MTIELWSLGKQDKKELEAAIDLYGKRLKHYTKYQIVTIDNAKIQKTLPKEQILDKEAELVLAKLQDKDILVTLDERGQQAAPAHRFGPETIGREGDVRTVGKGIGAEFAGACPGRCISVNANP